MRASRRPAARQPLADQQPAADCRSIATAAALTIAILIDPDALARAPAPKPPPPPATAAAPPPARACPPGRVTAPGGAAAGACVPGVAAGAGLAATVDVARPVAVGVSTVFFPERRTAAPDDGFGFGLDLRGSWSAAGCRSRRRRALRFEVVRRARRSACCTRSSSRDAPADPGQRWTFAAARADARHHPDLRGAGGGVGARSHQTPAPPGVFR